MGYNLLINGVYWGYNPLTNHLLTSWDIQVDHCYINYDAVAFFVLANFTDRSHRSKYRLVGVISAKKKHVQVVMCRVLTIYFGK